MCCIHRIVENNKKNYPILLFPQAFENNIHNLNKLDFYSRKPTAPIPPKRPNEPSRSYKDTPKRYVKYEGIGGGGFYNFLIHIGWMFICFLFFAFINNINNSPIIILIGFVSFFYGSYFLNTRFPQYDKYEDYTASEREALRIQINSECEREFQQAKIKYQSELEVCEKKEKEYQKEYIEYQNRLSIWKRTFNNSVNREINSSVNNISSKSFQRTANNVVREGSCESQLFIELEKKYSQYIKVDSMISGYYPDLVLWINGIGVDIEIDEPYTIENGITKEIHYLFDYNGESVDKRRNDTFVANDWYVLRFAESQIKNNLPECLQVIQALVNFITSKDDNKRFLEEFTRISNRISVNTWTKERARVMARTNYRMQ